MKKLIALLSVLALIVLASCGKTEVIEENTSTGSEIENNDIVNDDSNIIIGDEVDNSSLEEENTSNDENNEEEPSLEVM